MMSELDENLGEISRLCRQFGVKRLDVFGSVATEAFDPARSDIDFVVDFEEVASHIRINDQFRVCFRWNETGAEDVEIVDYH